jgi:glycosyltransferase involved in cell wall biosynthesis
LRTAFPTIINQDPDEIVFVDDGSTDGTKEYILDRVPKEIYQSKRFWYFDTFQPTYRKGSHGPPWNKAVSMATNDVVVMQCAEVACFGWDVHRKLVDAVDDHTIALARCIGVPEDFALPSHSHAERQHAFDGEDVIIKGDYKLQGMEYVGDGRFILCGHERPQPYIFCGAFKKELWTNLGGYCEKVERAADRVFALRALAAGVRFKIVGDAVTFHIDHDRR